MSDEQQMMRQAEAVKTAGQAALEDLLKVRDRLVEVDRRFKTVLTSIGATKGGVAPGAGTTAKANDQFFPALTSLTADLGRLADDLELKATDFEQRF